VKEGERKPGPFPYYGANGQQGTINGYLFDEPLVLLAEDGGFFDQPQRGVAYRISGKTWVNNHAHVLRPKPFMDIGFLCRVLENYDLAPFITGTTRGKLTKAGAEEVPIPVPPIHEQRRVAAILDQADTLRRKRQEAMGRISDMSTNVFVAMFGNPVRNERNWPTEQLGEITSKIGSGATPTGGEASYKAAGIALIRSMNVHDGVFVDRGLAYIDEIQARKLNNVEVYADDVLLNITGASIARVCRAPARLLPARVNQHVSIIRPKQGLISSFLEAALLHPATKTKLLSIGEAGATRQAITKAEIQQLDMILPPLHLQVEFAKCIANIELLKSHQSDHLDKLDGLFASLQHRAFRGEL
jgi:type I restriction enzyme S subunit